MRTFERQASGLCPQSGKNETIKIVFGEVTMVGEPKPAYFARGIRCNYASEHRCDLGEDCPLVQKETNRLNQL